MIARQHRPDWWIGKAPGAVFFGRSYDEVQARWSAWLRLQDVGFYDGE